ncbi:UNKNOWN [Stylonychia lemnae]|uniref:Uncharacterized protein n=1 Tax=Stylonychia lemnae TaxID=5949 RepID=A0A078AIJ3_STYLE|nr:UNKNOWN [Stylonychia lemnae]|eukprot:CDW82039.1 UNKNOWN [Stylonychia lemnae]
MQKSFALTLLLSALCVHQSSAIGVTGVIEVIAGITDGIIQKDDLSEFQKCITDAESLETYIDQAIGDFEEGGLAGYSEALMQVQQLIMALPSRVQTCESIHEDLTKLGQWAEIFLEPATFIKTVSENLIFNYSTIGKDVDVAMTDYKTNDFFDFGEKLGEILIVATKQ